MLSYNIGRLRGARTLFITLSFRDGEGQGVGFNLLAMGIGPRLGLAALAVALVWALAAWALA